MPYRKIVILGGPFTGKSWLAGRLTELMGARAFDLGAPGADAGALVEEALRAQAWIIEEHREQPDARALDAADLVVLVQAPAWLRALRRARGLVGGPRARRTAAPPVRTAHVLETLRRAGERGFLCRTTDDVRRLLDHVVGLGDPPRHE